MGREWRPAAGLLPAAPGTVCPRGWRRRGSGLWRRGRCAQVGVPAFSVARRRPRQAPAARSGTRWQQWGSLPPGWAGWVAVGVGSQAGLLPTLCLAPRPESFPMGVRSQGSSPSSRATAWRGTGPLRHRGLSSRGSGWCPRAFALSGEAALQTPGFSQVPARPVAVPRDAAAPAPRAPASPAPAYLGGPLAGVRSSWQCQKCGPAQPRPPSPQCNRAQPDLSWRGLPGCPAPPRPPSCLLGQGGALLPPAGPGGHLAEQVRAGGPWGWGRRLPAPRVSGLGTEPPAAAPLPEEPISGGHPPPLEGAKAGSLVSGTVKLTLNHTLLLLLMPS